MPALARIVDRRLLRPRGISVSCCSRVNTRMRSSLGAAPLHKARAGRFGVADLVHVASVKILLKLLYLLAKHG